MRFRDIATTARIELLEPLSQRPSRRYLNQLASNAVQTFYNEVNSGGRPWSVQETDLVVSPGFNEYVVPASGIAHILDVTTKTPGNPSYIETPIPFWDFNELRADWGGPSNLQWPTGYDSVHTAQRIAFFRKDFSDDTWAQVWPVPQSSSTYRVLYSQTGDALSMSLDDTIFMAQHNHLITTQVSLDALAGSAWWVGDENEKMNIARRNELEKGFLRRMPVYMDQFRRYIKSLSKARRTQRVNMYSID